VNNFTREKTLVIRPIIESDLNAVVRIHTLAFSDRALIKLGAEAIRRYYLWQLNGPHASLCIGVFDDSNKMRGFCFGGVFRGALSGFIQKNRSFLVWRVLTHPWLAANPLFLERLKLARNILIRRRAPAGSHSVPRKKSFGILSIAVDPHMQGAGYGRQLMAEAERIAIERGFVDMHLTVAIDNFQAITFYEKLGWQKLLAFDGIWHGTMGKHLESVSE
jgi:ribosomal protein S18 acetylase RimI-like enzyme